MLMTAVLCNVVTFKYGLKWFFHLKCLLTEYKGFVKPFKVKKKDQH